MGRCCRGFISFSAFALTATIAASGLANDIESRRLPDEYSSAPGHGLSLNNAGAAASGGLEAVAINPALLAMERTYSVSGAYHWPSAGREFYQAGVVDSVTSSFAAGFSYTSFLEKYRFLQGDDSQGIDSPLKRRFRLGLASVVGKLSVGASAQYIEAYGREGIELKSEKGTTFGVGIAMLVTPTLRIGVSGANLANRKVADYAPTSYRAGASLLLGKGLISIHGDYHSRERVGRFEGCEPRATDCQALPDSEQTVLLGATVTAYDLLRFLVSYGHVLEEQRNVLSGGLAIVSDKYSMSYSVRQPVSGASETHQAVNLTVSVAI